MMILTCLTRISQSKKWWCAIRFLLNHLSDAHVDTSSARKRLTIRSSSLENSKLARCLQTQTCFKKFQNQENHISVSLYLWSFCFFVTDNFDPFLVILASMMKISSFFLPSFNLSFCNPVRWQKSGFPSPWDASAQHSRWCQAGHQKQTALCTTILQDCCCCPPPGLCCYDCVCVSVYVCIDFLCVDECVVNAFLLTISPFCACIVMKRVWYVCHTESHSCHHLHYFACQCLSAALLCRWYKRLSWLDLSILI